MITITKIFEEVIFITALIGMLGILTIPITFYQLWLNLPVQILIAAYEINAKAIPFEIE